jgi:hypothetical protein
MRIPLRGTFGAIALAAALAASNHALGQKAADAAAAQVRPVQAPLAGKVFGYQDAETGEFHALNRVAPDTVSTTDVTGEYEVTATITLKTPLPAGYGLYCLSEIDALAGMDLGPESLVFVESSFSTAKVTGSTATCTMNTPYAWPIPTADLTEGNQLQGVYEVAMLPTATGSKALSKLAFLDRASIGSFLNATKFPAAGTITKVSVAATL